MEWYHIAAVLFVVIALAGTKVLMGFIAKLGEAKRIERGFTHKDGRYMIRIHDGRWRVLLDGVPVREGEGEDKAAAFGFLESHKRWMSQ
jgi:hypothetical protein